MNDSELIKTIEQVTDPKQALRILVEEARYLGYDPYYSDLRQVLLTMCKRCSI